MSLRDPHLCDALKVQIQITGASQVPDTFAATLHYQLTYRLQNHAFDVAIPEIAQSNDALLIQVDPGMTPMCTFVPKQLDKEQMKKLFPEKWITKYETFHQASQPIQSNTPFFIRNQNGDVEVRFMTTTPEKEEVTVFPTAMLQPVFYEGLDGLQIKAFREDGKPVYEGKSSTGHIWWDVCDCEECREEEVFEEDQKRRKKKSSQQILKERYEARDPEVDLLGEPSGRFDYYVLYPRSRKQKPPSLSPCKESHDQNQQNQKPPLIPYYQKVLPQIQKCQPKPPSQTHTQKPLPCYMFDHASPSYSQNFPPLESFDHPQANVKHVWKIKNPIGTTPDGSKKQVSSAEAALNWQAENAVAQNQVLSKILDNQQKLTEAVSHTFSSSNSLIEDLKKKIQSIEQELEIIVSTIKDLSVSFPLIGQKEKEKKQLLMQLQSLENSQKAATQALPLQLYMPYQPRQSLYKNLSIPAPSPFSPVSPYQNLQPLNMTHPAQNPFKPCGIFSSTINLTPPPQREYQPRPKPQVKPQKEPPPIKKDKEPLFQPPDPTIGASSRPPDMNLLAINTDPLNPISSFLRALTLQEQTEPFVLPVIDDPDLNLSDLDLDEVFMTEPKVEEEDNVLRPKQPPPPPPIFPTPPVIPDHHTRLAHSSTTDSKHLFTLDNSPPSKWHEEIFNMYSWCTAELQAPNNTVAQIIAKFVARLTGRVRQWWINLGEYRQRQAAQSNTLEDFFTILHNEFLGSLTHYTEVARDEFLLMKCCSFERKDLEKHFDKMSSRYYAFNGMDDVNSKHTFLNSFPEPLGDETLRMMNLQKITLQQASLGEIYQHVLIALEKLCNQRKFLSEIDKIHSKLKDNCKKKDLQIKCYDKSCSCPTKRRNHYKKYSWKKKYSHPKKKFFRKKKWKFLKRKQFKGKNSKVSFVCRKPGHFAKNCPKKAKAAKLLEQAQIHADDTPFLDVESLFSLDDDYSPQALAAIAYSSSEEE
ncbi:hypothetical protein ACB092_05G230500 [Castanea dentata]